MKDDIDVSASRPQCRVIPDISLDQVDLAGEMGQVLPPPGREVVENADPFATLHQRLGEVGANEASPTSHQKVCVAVFACHGH